jgi:serine/threonine protein kinase
MLTSDADDAQVKIVDFGFATEVNGNNLRDLLGTPAYVAPEMLNHRPYGKPVDMWAFGVIVYVLLAGYLPFYAHENQVMYSKIKKGNFQFHAKHWINISNTVKDLIRGLLTLNPDRRLTVDQALNHEWFRQTDAVLEKKKLDKSMNELRRFQIRKRFRAAVRALMAIERFKSMLKIKDTSAIENQVAGMNINGVQPPPPPIPALPRIMNYHYFLGDQLGEGFYAKVYTGINQTTKDEVAVKVFIKKKMKAVEQANLQAEFELMKEIDHPNIVKYYEFFDEPDKFYLIMEKLYGGELFDRITKKLHYNENEAKDLAKVLLTAIKYLHDRNIIHR